MGRPANPLPANRVQVYPQIVTRSVAESVAVRRTQRLLLIGKVWARNAGLLASVPANSSENSTIWDLGVGAPVGRTSISGGSDLLHKTALPIRKTKLHSNVVAVILAHRPREVPRCDICAPARLAAFFSAPCRLSAALPQQIAKPTSTARGPGLTNSDGVGMVNAKFDDPTIVKTIEANEVYFDLSVDALLRLKEQGVSQSVIQAMPSAPKKSRAAQPTGAAPTVSMQAQVTQLAPSDLVDEVGVYQVLKGKLVAIEPEIVNWRTGGVVKNAVTLGLEKGHINSTIAGPHSKIAVATTLFGMAGSLVFYIHCLDGNSASEYQLLRFWQKGDRREFRSVTGGVLHMSGGAMNNVIEFRLKRSRRGPIKSRCQALPSGSTDFLRHEPPQARTWPPVGRSTHFKSSNERLRRISHSTDWI